MEWQWLGGRREGSDVARQDSTLNMNTAQNPGDTKTAQEEPSGNNPSGGIDKSKIPVITFDFGDLPDDRIIDPDAVESSTITWTRSNSSVIVETVSWEGLDDPRAKNYGIVAVDSSNTNLMLVKGDTVQLLLSDFISDTKHLENFRGNKMVIRLKWVVNDTQTSGYTVSRLFTVAVPSRDEDRLGQFRKQHAEDAKEPSGGSQTDNSDNGTGLGSVTSSSAMPTRTTSGTVVPSEVSIEGSGVSSGGSGSGSGQGGLSTGAVAGIAVAGAVVFLALVGGLVFWLLRRRRRGQDRGDYKNPAPSTTFMGGDKDAHQVAESPHSTYSHDQQLPLSNLGGAAAASRDVGGPGAHDHHDDDRDYIPYRDNDPGQGRPIASQRADGAGMPHGVSSSVAHLVEEGMTPEEIRRLEEEERQLDDAIQRHGQGR